MNFKVTFPNARIFLSINNSKANTDSVINFQVKEIYEAQAYTPKPFRVSIYIAGTI